MPGYSSVVGQTDFATWDAETLQYIILLPQYLFGKRETLSNSCFCFQTAPSDLPASACVLNRRNGLRLVVLHVEKASAMEGTHDY